MVKNGHDEVIREHEESKKSTLELLKEIDESLFLAESAISASRVRLAAATKKYEERLNANS